MSNLEQKAEEIAKQLCADSFSSKEEIVEKAVILGYMLCKKEYDEKTMAANMKQTKNEDNENKH